MSITSYSRSGYDFQIEVRTREYPWAAFRFWSKVTAAARTDTPSTPLSLDDLPFRPVQHHGATEEEAIDHAKRQIDDWFDAGHNGQP